MNIAIILASGVSLRSKTKKPKQFLKINNKRIVDHFALTLIKTKEIKKVIIVVSEEHLSNVKSIFKKYNSHPTLLFFCLLGSLRNSSIT